MSYYGDPTSFLFLRVLSRLASYEVVNSYGEFWVAYSVMGSVVYVGLVSSTGAATKIAWQPSRPSLYEGGRVLVPSYRRLQV